MPALFARQFYDDEYVPLPIVALQFDELLFFITWSCAPASANGAEDVIHRAFHNTYLDLVVSQPTFLKYHPHVFPIDIELATTAISSNIITIH